MILVNSRETSLNLFVLTNIVINFAFDKEAQVTFEGDLYEGMYRVLEGQFPEFRFSKKIDDISIRFRSDLLVDQIYRASQRKLKAQIEIVKIEEVLRDIKEELRPTREQIPDWVTISIVYKPKARKVRPINKNNNTRGTSREKLDQYKYLFIRDISQEYISQFKDYLLF